MTEINYTELQNPKILLAASLLILLPRIDPTGFMRVRIIIALRKRTLSPVRLGLEDSSIRSFMLFVVVSFAIGEYNLT
jgi:hypothetical protein